MFWCFLLLPNSLIEFDGHFPYVLQETNNFNSLVHKISITLPGNELISRPRHFSCIFDAQFWITWSEKGFVVSSIPKVAIGKSPKFMLDAYFIQKTLENRRMLHCERGPEIVVYRRCKKKVSGARSALLWNKNDKKYHKTWFSHVFGLC